MFTVLIMEPDPMVSSILEDYIARVPDFHVIGVVRNLEETSAFSETFNLLLTELHFPDGELVEWLHTFYESGGSVDFLPVTADRQYSSYMQCARLGAVDYIIKPFSHERLRLALFRYRSWRSRVLPDRPVEQRTLDRFYFAQKGTEKKEAGFTGGNAMTRDRVEGYIRGLHGEDFSLEEASKMLNMSKGTIRRYLDQMCKEKKITVESSYGKVGRPVNRYRENRW